MNNSNSISNYKISLNDINKNKSNTNKDIYSIFNSNPLNKENFQSEKLPKSSFHNIPTLENLILSSKIKSNTQNDSLTESNLYDTQFLKMKKEEKEKDREDTLLTNDSIQKDISDRNLTPNNQSLMKLINKIQLQNKTNNSDNVKEESPFKAINKPGLTNFTFNQNYKNEEICNIDSRDNIDEPENELEDQRDKFSIMNINSNSKKKIDNNYNSQNTHKTENSNNPSNPINILKSLNIDFDTGNIGPFTKPLISKLKNESISGLDQLKRNIELNNILACSSVSLDNNYSSNTGLSLIDSKLKMLGEFNNNIAEKIKLLKKKLTKNFSVKGNLLNLINLKSKLFEKIITFMSNSDVLSLIESSKELKSKLIDITKLKAKHIVKLFESKYKPYFQITSSLLTLSKYKRDTSDIGSNNDKFNCKYYLYII